MISSNATRSTLSDSSGEHAPHAPPFAPAPPIWRGFLHEFRNHLTVLMAAASELRMELPPILAARVGDAIFETERNVQGLTTLGAILDASVRADEALITPLGEVVDRALRLAAPCAGPRTSIIASVPRETGVRNRGSALEALLAALLIDLAKSYVATDAAPSPLVRLDAEVGRRGLSIELTCAGARLDAVSWRSQVANELAAKLGATLSVVAAASAYEVQFR
jgi:hypothetical protein